MGIITGKSIPEADLVPTFTHSETTAHSETAAHSEIAAHSETQSEKDNETVRQADRHSEKAT